jgi:hypothetical protein
MSHITVVGVTEQQQSSCNNFSHLQHWTQSSPGNDSDQNPSHIGHCESSTMFMLTFLAFADFLLSVLAFLAFGCFMLAAFIDFFSLKAESFCLLFLFCSAMFSTRDCLYGELVTILDSSDLFDFFFLVREAVS